MIKWIDDIYEIRKCEKTVLMNPGGGTWVRISNLALEECNNHIINKEKNTIDGDYQELYRILEAYGMLYDTEEKKGKSTSINTVYFLTTLQCNMECDFCCVCASPIYEEEIMEKSDLQKMVDEIAKFNVRKVIFTGGEPFLYENLTFAIKQLKLKSKSKIQICTNGILLNDRTMHIFEYVDLVDISVENLFIEKNSKENLEALENKIRKIKKHGTSVCISYVATKYNTNFIYDFLDYAYKNEVALSLKVVTPAGRANDNVEILIDKDYAFDIMKHIYEYTFTHNYFNEYFNEFLFPAYVPEKSCAASGKILSIYPDGKIYSCFMLNKREFYLGNIKNMTLDKVLDNIKVNNETDLYKNCFDKDCKKKCKDCTVRYFCEGNCSGISSEKDTNVLCEFYKKYFTFFIWHYSEARSLRNNLEDFLKFMDEE